ncbi:hypothetical protein [Streptomyces vastus]|uniref:hypothetical protein n=1 Tax=Streptomyces vastus TaxID=285451 RepID=UPI0031DD0726
MCPSNATSRWSAGGRVANASTERQLACGGDYLILRTGTQWEGFVLGEPVRLSDRKP